MPFIKSLRTKTILFALLPTILVLVVVALIALYAYEQVARDVVRQRDTELARITAARLSEGLSSHGQRLQNVAGLEDIQSLEPDRLRSALESAQDELYVFNAGTIIYDDEGMPLISHPPMRLGPGDGYSVESEFEMVRNTLRPAYSDVFTDPVSEEDLIIVLAPIVGRGNEVRGAPGRIVQYQDFSAQRNVCRAPGAETRHQRPCLPGGWQRTRGLPPQQLPTGQ